MRALTSAMRTAAPYRRRARARRRGQRPAAKASLRRGVASVLALFFLVVLCSLAVAFVTGSVSQLHQADGLSSVQRAMLQAEGGLSYLAYQLETIKNNI